MEIVYVTSRYPYGPGEAFLGPEIAAHIAAGWDVVVFPAIRRGALQHSDAEAVVARAAVPSTLAVARDFVRHVVRNRTALRAWLSIVRRPQSVKTRVKNMVVLWRLGSLIQLMQTHRAAHIHAHWGGSSSTLALAASRATGVPWSLTLHRWDIYANNLLDEKVTSASFTRVISDRSAADVRSIVPHAEPIVLHMGVDVPVASAARGTRVGDCRFVCVASLIPVKDHATLLHAFASVAADGGASLDLVGDGPLEAHLRALAAGLGIADRVAFAGLVDHHELLGRMRAGEWDAIVLASASSGSEHEGIPVSLMEAMAAGIPPLATDSGATRELVTDEAGILVRPGDRQALADGFGRLIASAELRGRLAESARMRVAEGFDAERIAGTLRAMIASAAAT